AKALEPTQPMQSSKFAMGQGTIGSVKPDVGYSVIDNTPITPENSSLKVFFRLLLAALALAVLAYIYFQRG
ncbi:MAG TPA: hypothetical protein VK466_11125, partial [Terriglobales bacterium]|nr:hypothetical protein [Terriglobales bacterium]